MHDIRWLLFQKASNFFSEIFIHIVELDKPFHLMRMLRKFIFVEMASFINSFLEFAVFFHNFFINRLARHAMNFNPLYIIYIFFAKWPEMYFDNLITFFNHLCT